MMDFQADSGNIRWSLHLSSPAIRVYQALATDRGRASFWAESAVERNGSIHFVFPNAAAWDGEILLAEPPHRYTVRYYGSSTAAFVLQDDGHGGTDLTLTDTGVPAADRTEVIAGWVSVLLALKAAVDFGVDLRNHDPLRQWDNGYADN
jgi:uncharacterized protein YndB with AHSA1/START domain